MRRGRIFFYLAFIVILGLVAVFLVYQRLNTVPPAPTASEITPTPVDLVNILVLTQRLGRGAFITEDVVKDIQIPRSFSFEGMISDRNEVLNRRAKFDLESGIPLTRGMLVNTVEELSTTGSTASLSIPAGYVAVAVPLNRLSSVAYALQPGDHVNVMMNMMFVDMDTDFQSELPNRASGVIAPGQGTASGASSGKSGPGGAQAEGSSSISVESQSLVAVPGGGNSLVGRVVVDSQLGHQMYLIPSEAQRPRLASALLFKDVMVLKVGNFPLGAETTNTSQTTEAAPAATEQPPTNVVNPQVTQAPVEKPDVVTLILHPQDALTMNYLMPYIQSGTVQLNFALRSAGDNTPMEDVESVTLQFLLDNYKIAIPVKLPYGPEPAIRSLVLPVLGNDYQPTPQP